MAVSYPAFGDCEHFFYCSDENLSSCAAGYRAHACGVPDTRFRPASGAVARRIPDSWDRSTCGVPGTRSRLTAGYRTHELPKPLADGQVALPANSGPQLRGTGHTLAGYPAHVSTQLRGIGHMPQRRQLPQFGQFQTIETGSPAGYRTHVSVQLRGIGHTSAGYRTHASSSLSAGYQIHVCGVPKTRSRGTGHTKVGYRTHAAILKRLSIQTLRDRSTIRSISTCSFSFLSSNALIPQILGGTHASI